MPELDSGSAWSQRVDDGEAKDCEGKEELVHKKRVWCPSRHVDWVNRQIQNGRLTSHPVTAVLSLEFVIEDRAAVLRAGWLDEARCAVVAALTMPVTVVLDGSRQVVVEMMFRRQNPKSHYFVTTSGWSEPFQQAFVAAVMDSAERTLRTKGLPVRIAYLLTKPMGSFFIETRLSAAPPEIPATSPAKHQSAT